MQRAIIQAATVAVGPGQGALAAIAEIVAMLTADPCTDGIKVDTGGLRTHLVDTDKLVTSARVRITPVADGAEFRVLLQRKSGAAAGRLLRVHTRVLAAETGWSNAAQRGGETIVWGSNSSGDGEKTRAPRYFGLTTGGGHRRARQLQMATGGLGRQPSAKTARQAEMPTRRQRVSG